MEATNLRKAEEVNSYPFSFVCTSQALFINIRPQVTGMKAVQSAGSWI